MRLVLINLYSNETMARYLLSSYVLKAYLDKVLGSMDELKIDILNFNTDTDVEKICAKIINSEPCYVGYSCYTWNIEKILKVIKKIKENSNFVHILGGPEISLDRISSFSSPSIADYYVIGEGEKALANLLLYLKKKSEFPEIEIPNGVAYWNGSKIVYAENIDLITNLDEVPSVYLTGTLDDFLYDRQQAFLETQRGCKFKCKYCVYHKNLPALSFYSLSRVYDELDYLIVEKQVMALRIFDSIFTTDLPRAKKIVRHLLSLKEKGIRLPWIYWEFTYNSVDEEFINLVSSLKERGEILNTNECPALDKPQLYSDLLKDYIAINGVGIQSFCKEALKAIGRAGITNERLKLFMDMTKKHNIVLKLDLIMGLPMETFNSYFNGLEIFLPYFENTDHVLNIHRLQILPGSELETLCGRYGINYSRVAPHYVLSTTAFPEQQLNFASKLTAILFRILNSPLRGIFFKTKAYYQKSYYDFIRCIFDAIMSSGEFRNTRLCQNEIIHDYYWNTDIFKEIPSAWLISLFETIHSTDPSNICI